MAPHPASYAFGSRLLREPRAGVRARDGSAAILSVLGLFLFLTTPATAEEATPIRDGGQGRATSMYFETTRRVLRAYDGDHESDQLRHALAKDAVELLKAHADRGRSIEDQPVLTRLQEALQRSVAGLPLADRMKADIAAIHLADRDGDSEDVVLFGLEVLRFSPVIAIHRIASTYDVLPASVPLGRGVFVDGIRALDVTGDGIKEAVVTHGDDGSAGTVHVDVLRWVGGTESFRRIFAMALSDRGGPPCAYRFVPAANGQDIEAIVPVVGVFDGRVPHQAATQLWKYDPFADAFVSRGESVEPTEECSAAAERR